MITSQEKDAQGRRITTVDADSHVIEGDHTWDFLEPEERRFRPVVTDIADTDRGRYWVMEPQSRDIRIFNADFADKSISEGVRDLTDPAGRMAKLDELGIDVQVVYPSFFLRRPTERPDIMVALSRSYNRFMAQACKSSKGRLRWILVPPVVSMTDALAEIEFGRQNGACGILLSGVEGRLALFDPYFFPLYEKASAAELPICCHLGIGNADIAYFPSSFYCARSPVLAAFHDLLIGGVPDRFPQLRFGFVETGASWLPFVIGEVRRLGKWRNSEIDPSSGAKRTKPILGSTGVTGDEGSIMRDKRMFVTCRVDDDIAYILKWAGKGSLMTGTDLGHDDFSRDLFAFETLRESGLYDAETVEGIVCNNARTFYGI